MKKIKKIIAVSLATILCANTVQTFAELNPQNTEMEYDITNDITSTDTDEIILLDDNIIDVDMTLNEENGYQDSENETEIDITQNQNEYDITFNDNTLSNDKEESLTDQQEEQEIEIVMETITAGDGLLLSLEEFLPETTEELFTGYAELLASGNKSKTKKCAGDKLTGANKGVYNRLKEMIGEVASGERSSTNLEMTIEEAGLSDIQYTASDLGVSKIVSNGSITQEAIRAINNIQIIDVYAIVISLLSDCPFSFYWYDKIQPFEQTPIYLGVRYDYDINDYVICLTGSFAFKFPVAEEYAIDTYTVDTSIGQSLETVASTANAIVNRYANGSDYEKIRGYTIEICNRVEYNYEATENLNIYYGNPWQLIWVFDGDPTTNVVCEGYSKAFQYLCNLTDFDNADSIIVSGIMSDGQVQGPHMWNVVTMEDGNNYIADITNYDGWGSYLPLLAGGETRNDVIYISIPAYSKFIAYIFDNDTKLCYNENDLAICNQSYVPHTHNPETISGTPATCTTPGLTDGIKCSICNTILTEQEEIPPLGHKSVIINKTPATCTTSGLTAGEYCSRCGNTLVEQEVIPALGHIEEVIPAILSTCTKTGLTEGKKCSRCDKILIQQEITPILGHIEETIEGTAATCTTSGLTNGKKCSRCNTILVSQNNIPALGHIEITISGTPATCTTSGLTTGKKCSRCNQILAEQKIIPALGHLEETIPAVIPTCTENGLTNGTKCSRCNTILVEQETVPATGHNWNEWIITKEPTEQEEGRKKRTCKNCYLIETSTIGKLEHTHTIVDDIAINPTCTTTGKTAGQHCSSCGEIIIPQTIIPALGHDPIAVNGTPATCTADGLTNGTKCSRCNAKLTEREIIPALGHSPVIINGTPATCTKNGLSAGEKCSRCNTILIAQEIIPATGHTPEVISGTPATCTETGLTNGEKCKICNTTISPQEIIPALGHTPETIKGTPATCTTSGFSDGVKCSTCNIIITAQEEIPALGHNPIVVNGTPATCTETGLADGSKCSRCNTILVSQTTIPATGHEWNEWITTKDPTEQEEGLKKRTCKKCNFEETSIIGKLEHEHVIINDIAIEPTCTEPGKTSGQHCFTCGEIIIAQEIIPATGHTSEIIKGTPAICTENGITDGIKCSICNTILTPQEVIPALGHAEITINGKQATCTEDGLTNGTKCSRCNTILIPQETIQKLGHISVTVNGTSATCTSNGLTDGTKCSRCNTTLITQEIIPATGHSPETIKGTPATCTENGMTDGEKCHICNTILTAQEVIPKKGHKQEIIEGIPATCTTSGKTDGIKCSVCDTILVAQETISPLGHIESSINGKPATCIESGLTNGIKCSRCNTILIEQEIIPATGHDWNDWITTKEPTEQEEGSKTRTCKNCNATETSIIGKLTHTHNIVNDEAIAPTCTESGKTEGKHCSKCGEIIIAQEIIPALGHIQETINGTPATCTENGLTDGIKCSRCNTILNAQEIIQKSGHTKQTIKGMPATCTENGLTDGVKCSICDVVLTAQQVIPATGHNPEIIRGTQATCTTSGITDGIKCSTCNEILTKQEVLPALGHTQETIDGTPATCTENGLTDGIKCSVCERILTTQESIPATGHNWNDWVIIKEPTEQEEGLKSRTCKNCHQKETSSIGKLEHTHNIIVDAAIDATCTETGKTAGQHCSTCGEVIIAQTDIPALGHTMETINGTSPTCTKTGLTNGTRCSVCGIILTEQTVIPATGHIYEIIEGTPASCTENGLTNGKKCSVCNEILVAQESIPATGHNWNEWITTKEPTEQEEGIKTRTCKNCNTTETSVIGKLAHTHKIVNDTAIEPTCTTTGKTAGQHCSTCGETIIAQTDIPALGHITETIKGTPATCTETGLTDGTKCSRCNTIITEQQIIPATGHTKEVIKGTAETCTKNGLTNGEKCSVCNEILTQQEIIPATGHNWNEWITTKEPTETTEGIKHRTCKNCNAEETSIIGKINHVHTLINDTAIEPTCTTTGKTAGQHCATCGEVIIAQENLPALGHTTEIINGTSATCTKDGLTNGIKCIMCNTILTPQEVIPATGHTKEIVKRISPTCTQNGLTNGEKCSVCNEILTPQEIIPATGHDWDEWIITKKPTEQEEGIKTRNCKHCNEEETSIIGKLTHSHTLIDDTAIEPTCTESGKTAGQHCSVCGEVVVAQETIPALGHITEVIKGTPATCTETGLTDGTKCSRCNTILTEQKIIQATGHDWNEWVITKEATEQETGLKKRICKKCNAEETSVIGKQNHTHTIVNDAAITPTCTDSGKTAGQHCSECGEVITPQEIIPPNGHSLIIIHGTEATCTKNGRTDGEKCSVCNKILTKQEIVPATGHDWNEWVITKEATEQEEGLKTRICKKCNAKETSIIGKITHTHTITDDTAVQPTCTKSGKTAGQHCSVCGEIIKTQEVIPALGHDFDEWKTTTQPTEQNTGIKTRVCKRCKQTETEIIEKIQHTHTIVNDVATTPTCTKPGKTAGQHCLVCGQIIIEQKTIPQLNHILVDIKGTPATCTKTGLTAGQKCSACGKITVPQKQIKALGHNWGTWSVTTKATTTKTGTETRICTRCKTKETRKIAKLKKKDQQMTINVKPISIKETKTKKKKQTIKASKVFSIKNAQGMISYKKKSGSKKLSISNTGKITIKKGTKKGTYKMKVTVTASGNNIYNMDAKIITVKIKVK